MARDSSVGRFWHVCQHARHAADPDGMADQELQNRERRRLSVRACEDSMVSVGGLLDPVGGAALRTALQPLSRKSGAGDERTLEQRQADALVDMANHALDVNPVRSRPHLNVTANLGTLYRIPGSAGGEMDMAPPVGSDTVQRIACDCSIGRVLFEGDSLIVDMGRAKRVVSPATRRALDARDHHCRWPGCDRLGTWCEAHHLVHWIHGGPTDLTNLVLLCYRHHMMVHEGRWKLVLYPDGRLEVIKPPLDFLAWARGPTLAA